ncbi:hypothetical protein GF327_01845, partial [Candidatus Woesearchaeota archaeon]|nr:hypothetical protein [Candidatus Woesearchaeota archaeon]
MKLPLILTTLIIAILVLFSGACSILKGENRDSSISGTKELVLNDNDLLRLDMAE